MFGRNPTTLTDARLQAHWASQLLSASADAMLKHAEDDSHSNVGFEDGTLVARNGVTLALPTLVLGEPGGESLALSGRELPDALAWLSEKLGKEIVLRDYEMPEHAVAEGAAFDVSDGEAFEQITAWFGFAQQAMNEIAPSRIWPHHFDLGWLVTLDNGKQIGGGFAPGDGSYDQPYFYVNPYGLDARPDDLPTLPAGGFWTAKWFGAVLTAEAMLAGDAQERAGEFLSGTVQVCRALLVAG